MDIRKRIAFTTYGDQQCRMLNWVDRNVERLRPHKLYAVGILGQLLILKAGLSVNRLNSVSHGGEQQLLNMMVNSELDMLFMFWDAVTPNEMFWDAATPNGQDVAIRTLLRLAVMNDIAVACNEATADFMLTSGIMGQTYMAGERGSICGMDLLTA